MFAEIAALVTFWDNGESKRKLRRLRSSYSDPFRGIYSRITGCFRNPRRLGALTNNICLDLARSYTRVILLVRAHRHDAGNPRSMAVRFHPQGAADRPQPVTHVGQSGAFALPAGFKTGAVI